MIVRVDCKLLKKGYYDFEYAINDKENYILSPNPFDLKEYHVYSKNPNLEELKSEVRDYLAFLFRVYINAPEYTLTDEAKKWISKFKDYFIEPIEGESS